MTFSARMVQVYRIDDAVVWACGGATSRRRARIRTDKPDQRQASPTNAKRAVKWRSIGGCSTIRIPRRDSARSATQRATSIT